MRWWRSKSVGRVLALSLLLWTVIDLTNAGACALDNEGLASFATTATVSGGSASLPDTIPAAHVDDCFCCSHCVEVQSLPASADVPVLSARLTLLPDALPSLLFSSFYHPPQSPLL